MPSQSVYINFVRTTGLLITCGCNYILKQHAICITHVSQQRGYSTDTDAIGYVCRVCWADVSDLWQRCRLLACGASPTTVKLLIDSSVGKPTYSSTFFALLTSSHEAYSCSSLLVESAMATNNSVTAFLNSGLSSLHNCSSLVLSKPATAVCSAPLFIL